MGSAYTSVTDDHQITLAQNTTIWLAYVGSICGIILIVIYIISIYKQNDKVNKHVNRKNKCVSSLSIATLIVLLVPLISLVALRISYDETVILTRCYLGYILFYPCHLIGQWMLSTLFLYRLFIIESIIESQSNHHRVNKQNKLTISISFGILSLLLILWLLIYDKAFVTPKIKIVNVTFCYNIIEQNEQYPVIVALALQTVYQIYVLSAFITTFRKLNPEQNPKIKLMIRKACIYVGISVLITWIFIIIFIIISAAAIAITWSIIIDATCSYLLFFVKYENTKELQQPPDQEIQSNLTTTEGEETSTKCNNDTTRYSQKSSKQHCKEIMGSTQYTQIYGVSNVAGKVEAVYMIQDRSDSEQLSSSLHLVELNPISK